MRHAVDQSRPPRLSPRAHGASHWTGRQRRVAARRAPHLAKRALLGLALALVWVGVSGLAWGQPTLSVTSSLSGAEDGSVGLFDATTVSSPDSNTMEAVVTVTAGSGVIDSGLISGTSVSSQGDRSAINGFLDDLTFVPDPDWAGAATVELKVESDYGTRNDGDVITETITVTIASINDAPAGSDATISIDEEQAYTIGAGDFGFADPSDGPPDALASVDIVGLPADGTLTIDGTQATSAGTVTEAQLNANELVFTPDDDDFGDGYASLAFRVRDDGGTANGGVDLDPTANTLTFDVANLNDAPVAKDTNETVDKNGSLTFDLSVPEDAYDVDGSADVTGFPHRIRPVEWDGHARFGRLRGLGRRRPARAGDADLRASDQRHRRRRAHVLRGRRRERGQLPRDRHHHHSAGEPGADADRPRSAGDGRGHAGDDRRHLRVRS